VSTQSYKVVKGTSKSLTTEMRTVMRTTDTPVTKGAKLTLCEKWEIDVVRGFSLKRTSIIVSTGGYPRWPPVPRDPLGLC